MPAGTGTGTGTGAGGGGGGGMGWQGGTNASYGTYVSKRSEYETRGGRWSPLSLVSDPGVRAELGLDPGQRDRLDALLAEVDRGESNFMALAVGRGNDHGDTIRADGRRRDEQLAELRREMTRIGDEIEQVLTPAQRDQVRGWCAAERAAAGLTPSPAGHSHSTSVAPVKPRTGASPPGLVIQEVYTGGGGYSGGGDPGSVVRVMLRPEAGARLRLSPQQEKRVDALLGEFGSAEDAFRVKSARVTDARRDWRAAWREGYDAAVEEARRASTRGQEELLALLTPTQRQRLDEIGLQVAGTSALFRPQVIMALKLGATQQARLAALRQQARKQADQALGLGGSRPADPGGLQRAEAIQRNVDRQMLTSVLTPEQQAAWRRMQGKPLPGIERFRVGGGGVGGGDGG